MTHWLTSQKRKRHQCAMNKLVREFNKTLEKDDLWRGRFMVQQESAQWVRYSDGSGAELFVRLKFIDRARGRYYYATDFVNRWRGINGNGYRLWEKMNWLITEHWNVWSEPLARSKSKVGWRIYNECIRKV